MAFWKKKDKDNGKSNGASTAVATPPPADDVSSEVDPLRGLAQERAMKAPAPALPPRPGGPARPGAPARAGVSAKPGAPAAPKPAMPVPEKEEAARHGESSQITNLLTKMEAAGIVDANKVEDLKKRVQESEAAQPLEREKIETGLVESVRESDMLEAIAASIGMECVSLKRIEVPEEVLAEVDVKLARAYRIFPLETTPDTLTVAVVDPLDIRVTDELGLRLNKRIIAKLASESDIERAIANHYEGDRISSVIKDTIEQEKGRHQDEVAAGDADDEEESDSGGVINLDEADGPEEVAVVKFVNLLFREAIHERASDIHIEPTRYSVTIRFRIDGVLQEMPSPPKKWQNMIISRLKVMSRMDLSEKRVPQDGRIQLTIQSKGLDLRVSCLPSLYGESMVMRILDQSSIMLGLEDVGFLQDNIKLFNSLIRSPNGVIVMTGPTGSGKTTTLYAALNTLNNPETKIVTLEDPVEYQVQGINQMQVNKDVGLDFAMGLRTVLRQSPDVILVGEMRDQETAQAAIRAALTGHLVFSTLHTNDAPGATVRLIDMGVKPFLVASALNAAIGQRLIRRICSSCKTPYTYKPQEIAAVGVDPKEFLDHEFAIGRGCARCSNSGYRGRTAIHEIFVMDSELRQMVIRRESGNRIKAVAVRHGMRPLRMDGWQKCLRGDTTIEEIMRVTALD